jgi:Xaa-Pro aminopeptidase
MKRLVTAMLLLGLSTAMAAIEKEPLEEYRSRRERLSAALRGGIVVLFAAPEVDLNEYQQEDNFYYLTGFDEPNAVFLLDASSNPAEEYLFLPARNRGQERWTGPKLGPGEEAQKETGLRKVLAITEFEEVLRKATERAGVVHALKKDFDRLRSVVQSAKLEDVEAPIASFRQIKSPTEQALLMRAIEITMKAHQAAARTIAPGVMEYEVEAAIEFEFRRNGAERPGFPSIVGSGPYSTILHYDKSTRKMEAGDLVVVDIGAEYGGYSADITRTYPVSGKFSARQREIYQIVLDAQKAAIRSVKPGVSIGGTGVHKAAYDYIKSKGFAMNFIHGTSHHIGLDVHDVGSGSRLLEAGMAITVEPGIYIPEEQLGIRIEDDLIVTASGSRILSTFPKEIAEIEALMQKPN